MKKLKLLTAVIVTAVLASGYIVSSAPIKGKKIARNGRGIATRPVKFRFDPSPSIPPPEAVALLSPPMNPFKVEPMPVRGDIQPRTAQQDRLIEEAVAIVSRLLPVPPQREQFFSWVNGEDVPFKFWGWHAFVHDVSPIAGGWVISLTVRPNVTNRYLIGTAYVEEYSWVNGVLSFQRGYLHPKTPPRDYVRL
jgi:hypothetical protein